MRSGPGRSNPSGKKLVAGTGIRRKVFKHNPAGSKIARKAIEHRGLKWRGEVFHGGELTAENHARARRRLGLP